jgi:hypothetical protein
MLDASDDVRVASASITMTTVPSALRPAVPVARPIALVVRLVRAIAQG